MSEHNITIEGGTSKRLKTAGKYCDRDIIVTATGGGCVPEHYSYNAETGAWQHSGGTHSTSIHCDGCGCILCTNESKYLELVCPCCGALVTFGTLTRVYAYSDGREINGIPPEWVDAMSVSDMEIGKLYYFEVDGEVIGSDVFRDAGNSPQWRVGNAYIESEILYGVLDYSSISIYYLDDGGDDAGSEDSGGSDTADGDSADWDAWNWTCGSCGNTSLIGEDCDGCGKPCPFE